MTRTNAAGWESRFRARARRSTVLVAIFLLVSVAASSTSAKEYTAAQKFRRGISNIALGVLAIPGQMTTKTREEGWAIGLPLGFAQGLGWFAATEAIGVWEFLTSPFEFPPHFQPIIAPEYPWEYFEEGNPGAGRPRSSPSRVRVPRRQAH